MYCKTNDATLASDNLLRFRHNLLQRIQKLIITMIRLEMKNYYNINTEAAKMQILSLGKIGKYEYLTGKEISPFDHSRMTEKAFEK